MTVSVVYYINVAIVIPFVIKLNVKEVYDSDDKLFS